MKPALSPSAGLSSPSAGRHVYSVSEINRGIRQLLESHYAGVWIEGEISNFKKHTSGHMYLTLKDEKSQISAVFFSRLNQYLKFELKDGLKVFAFGKISLYEPRGQYQLTIERLEPQGLGALQLAFLQLREKLEKEGLFEAARKRPIPRFPRTVGIVTSPTGAAIRDILNVMNRRFAATDILLNPVLVQGEGAAAQIARAIEEMNGIEGIDVLIVGRGGGSLEDLWAFNEEVVARAVYGSKIPVISAVGHEIDWTICDLAADLRAPTPSAAAELVVQNSEELRMNLRDDQTRMHNAVRVFLRRHRDRLEALQESYAFKQPLVLVQQSAQRLDELSRQLQNYLKTLLDRKAQAFAGVLGKLETLSPLGILGRGYSLSFRESDGFLLKSAGDIRPGETLKTMLGKGIIHSKVTAVQKETGRGLIAEEVKP